MTTRMIDSAGSVAIQPFPPEHYPMLWGWLQEFPEQNFDDAGPKNLRGFIDSIYSRLDDGQEFFEVTHNTVPVGAIGIERRVDEAKFRGICFTREVHGRGIAAAAVSQILDWLFGRGVHAVTATYFSDNVAVRRMFQKLGAVDVEEIQNAATRAGRPVNATVVKIIPTALRMQEVA